MDDGSHDGVSLLTHLEAVRGQADRIGHRLHGMRLNGGIHSFLSKWREKRKRYLKGEEKGFEDGEDGVLVDRSDVHIGVHKEIVANVLNGDERGHDGLFVLTVHNLELSRNGESRGYVGVQNVKQVIPRVHGELNQSNSRNGVSSSSANAVGGVHQCVQKLVDVQSQGEREYVLFDGCTEVVIQRDPLLTFLSEEGSVLMVSEGEERWKRYHRCDRVLEKNARQLTNFNGFGRIDQILQQRKDEIVEVGVSVSQKDGFGIISIDAYTKSMKNGIELEKSIPGRKKCL